MVTTRLIGSAIALLLTLVAAGCNGSSSGPSGSQPDDTAGSEPRPLHAMRYRMLNGRWQDAWKYADAVLEQHGDDPEVLSSVAKVAHANQQEALAAELLMKACKLESFANEERVHQAVVGMVSLGKFYDVIPMLESAVAKQPKQHETRRLLYDFYIGSENRPAALVHGQTLIRQRQFDIPLLMNVGNAEFRTLDLKPLEEMSKRNPDDKRPLIGSARSKFDRRELDESITILKEILANHSDFLPAQALLASAYAASNQYGQLRDFTAKDGGTTDGIEAFSLYWLALGDDAREQGKIVDSAIAYWKATRRDPDHAEPWVKLARAISQPGAASLDLSPAQKAGVEQRAAMLTKFNQHHNRFERSGKASREVAIELARSLKDLGRLWEAEAWASISMTLPEDESVPASEVRKSIVALLTRNTPWQSTSNRPEFAVNLNQPGGANRVAKAAPAVPAEPTTSTGPQKRDVSYVLKNEATERGLVFFGRTGDDLDKPGIMLHRTLGCGGGTIDFDLDGWSDLYLATAGGTPAMKDSNANALMRNIEGHFVNCTIASSTGDRGFGQGVSVGDINEDGFADLMVLNYGRNTLLINNGDGSFRDATEQWFDSQTGNDWSTSGAIADIDGDGINDAIVVNYCAGTEPATETCPLEGTDLIPSCSPMLFPGEADLFFQGKPDGGFINQTTAWGGAPAVLGRGLGITVGLFDDKPGLDIFIANDMTNNHYWSLIRTNTLPENNEAASSDTELFESATPRGLACDDRAIAQGSMGIATGDLDRDGDIDFYVTNFGEEYNTFHENRSDGMWRDYTKRLNLSAPTLPLVGFGTEAIDLDNDGQLELILSNGHVDMFKRGKERSIYAQPMQVFRRTAKGAYESVGQDMPGDYLKTAHVGRALWTIDANRDGAQDIVVTHQTEPVALLINQTNNGDASDQKGHWISLQLRGTQSSRDAIGATVTIRDPNQSDSTWTSQVTAGSGYLCSNDPTVFFGTGPNVAICDVLIEWPGGRKDEFSGLATDRTWTLVEGMEAAFSQE